MRITTSLLLVLLFAAQPAAAQEDNARALARICVSEGGFNVSANECAAICAVLRNRARRANLPFSSMAHGYSSRVFDAGRADQRAYIAHLDGAEQPIGWPTRGTTRPIQLVDGTRAVRVISPPRWEQYRASWLRLRQTAQRILAGEITHDCAAEPLDWGGDMDTRRYRSRNLFAVVVDCGETSNTFWRPTIDQGASFDELILELARRGEPATIEGDVQPRSSTLALPTPRGGA